jgi:hypothetical protein
VAVGTVIQKATERFSGVFPEVAPIIYELACAGFDQGVGVERGGFIGNVWTIISASLKIKKRKFS